MMAKVTENYLAEHHFGEAVQATGHLDQDLTLPPYSHKRCSTTKVAL